MSEPEDSLSGGGGGQLDAAGPSAGQPLLDQGLRLYEQGELLSALALWEEALGLDPDLARAKEYIDYVRENYDALAEQFAAAAAAGAAAEAPAEEPWDAAPLPPPPASTGDVMADGLAAVDAGLDRALDTPYGMTDKPFANSEALAPLRPTPAPPRQPEAYAAAAADELEDEILIDEGPSARPLELPESDHRDDRDEDDDGDEDDEPAREIEMEAMAPDEELAGTHPGFDGFRGELEVTVPQDGPRPDPFAATAQVPPVMPPVVIQPRFGAGAVRNVDPTPPVRPGPPPHAVGVPPVASSARTPTLPPLGKAPSPSPVLGAPTRPPSGPGPAARPPSGPGPAARPPSGPRQATLPPSGPRQATLPPSGPPTRPPSGPGVATRPPTSPGPTAKLPSGPAPSARPPSGPGPAAKAPSGPGQAAPPKRLSPTVPPVVLPPRRSPSTIPPIVQPPKQPPRAAPTVPPAPAPPKKVSPSAAPVPPPKNLSPTATPVPPQKKVSPSSPPVSPQKKISPPGTAPVSPRQTTVPPVAAGRAPSGGSRVPTSGPAGTSSVPAPVGRSPSGGNRVTPGGAGTSSSPVAGAGAAAPSLAGRGGSRDASREFRDEDSMESRATSKRPIPIEPRDLILSHGAPDTDEPTRPAPRFARREAPPQDDFDLEQTGDFDDLRKTHEHLGAPERRPAPPRGAPAVIVDKDLLSELDEIAHEDLGGDDEPIDLLSAPLAAAPPSPRRAPPSDPDRTNDFPKRRSLSPPLGVEAVGGGTPREERVRRRVETRLRDAQDAAEKGDFIGAVTAVEAAQRDDEDGTVAPVLLHRHRDLLYRIYEGHIGDMTAVPLVAVPLHEIAAHALDHRTGFLLSRIDGMLTFEDILDVAGMPRMEAYQILSNLLRKGVIEVR